MARRLKDTLPKRFPRLVENRDVEALKEYPYGCNEQMTTKLLAIYYEEEIKRLMGNNEFLAEQLRKLDIEPPKKISPAWVKMSGKLPVLLESAR